MRERAELASAEDYEKRRKHNIEREQEQKHQPRVSAVRNGTTVSVKRIDAATTKEQERDSTGFSFG